MNTLFKRATRTPRTFTTTIKMFSTTAKPQKQWAEKKVLIAGCRG
jgi:nucleoside-diphosphate-sugar epimerase